MKKKCKKLIAEKVSGVAEGGQGPYCASYAERRHGDESPRDGGAFRVYVEESKGEGMERCELLESAARLLSAGHVRREPLL